MNNLYSWGMSGYIPYGGFNWLKNVDSFGNLQLHLSLRMKLTKIHKVLEFKESDWMKIYIYFNIKKKKKKNAANSFEKNFFKLMINYVNGKIMENLRKKISVTVVNNEKRLFKTRQQTNFYFYKNI